MQNILQKLHQLFNQTYQTKISISAFMGFIFDDTSLPNSTLSNIESRNLYRYYGGESSIPRDIKNELKSIKNRNFTLFITDSCQNKSDILECLKNSLKDLCQEYFLPSNQDLDGLFNDLIIFCIENEMTKKFSLKSSAPLFKILRPRHCESFCSHHAEKDIMIHLKQNHILFLYSLSGTGKTELAKQLCRNYLKYGFKDVFMLSYTHNLPISLKKIKYQTPISLDSKPLEKKTADSLLIINKMTLSSVEEDFKMLSKLNLTILVTVDSISIPKGIPSYKLPSLSFENLKNIFETAYKNSITDKTAKHLIHMFNGHTLTIRLLGKALKKSGTDIDNFLTTLTTESLKSIPIAEVKYHDKKTTILRILSSIINCTDFKDTNILAALQMLSVFNGNDIELSLLHKWLPDISNHMLSQLIKDEILLYTDEEQSIVRMHRIIAEVIQSNIKFQNIFAQSKGSRKSSSPSFLSLMQHIQDTISDLRSSNYSATQLQDLSFSFFNVMNLHQIRFNTNKGQTHYSQEGNYWLTYCFECIHFYQEYGNTVYSECVLNSLLDSYAQISLPASLAFEKRFFKIQTKWQMQCLDNKSTVTLYEDIIDYIFPCQTKYFFAYDYFLQYTAFHMVRPTPIVLSVSCRNFADLLNTLDSCFITVEHLPQFNPKSTQEFNTIIISIYRNLTLLLQKVILSIKTDDSGERVILLLEQIIYLLNDLIAKVFNNSNSFAFLRHYMNIWLYTPAQAIQQINLLMELHIDKISRLQLLSDIVYFDAKIFLSNPIQQNMIALAAHYRQMNNLFSSCRGIPSFINESCYIATLYYALCRSAVDKDFFIETLSSMPNSYKKIVRLKDAQEYQALEKIIAEVLSNITQK